MPIRFLDVRHRSSGREPERRIRIDGRGPRRWVVLLLLAAAALLLLLVSCSSFSYTVQALAGGAGILARREPVEKLLRRSDLSSEERARLELAVALRDFSVAELELPDNGSYRSYVRLGREVVTWNVIAAPALSVEPVVWCFPIAGCVSYRGYFRERSAHRFAAELAAQGDDVTVSGAAAYSTLGWFDDPLLDTFLDEEPHRLAGLLFHELAHQVVYVKDDTTFNESFATAVEELGVERWLATRSGAADESERAGYERDRREEREVRALLLAARAELAALYAGAESETTKRAAKREILLRLGAGVDRALDDGSLGPRYAGWRGRAWNNADLAAVADYTLWVPALRALHERSGTFPAFYAAANELAELPAAARRERLEALSPSDARAAAANAPFSPQ